MTTTRDIKPTDQTIWLTGWSQDYEGEREVDLYPTLESATLSLSIAVDEQFGDTGVLDWKFRKDLMLNGTVRWEYADHTITATPYKLSDILAKA